jgi:hypothetical protein
LGAHLRTQPTEKEVIRMKKKKQSKIHRVKTNKPALHQIGRERFVRVQNYVGDIPTGEPIDWFEQADEFDVSENNEQTG